MRNAILLLHRWFGLGAALFLLMTALTGALLPWQHELDAWLNPTLFSTPAAGSAAQPLPAMTLARLIEQRHPDARVSYVPLVVEPGHAQAFAVEPRVDGVSGTAAALAFDQVFIDPYSGAELGTRAWGRLWPLGRENLMPFLYELHYSLHLGTWGTWLLGAVALLWLIDCFAGFYLTLPARRRRTPPAGTAQQRQSSLRRWQRWRPAWRIRPVGGYRTLFDLHRAVSLWLWLLLLIFSFTSMALNLYAEVFHPALTALAPTTASPYELREPGPAFRNRPAGVGFAEVLQQAEAEALRRGWRVGPGDIYHVRSYGFYRIKFFDAAHPYGASPLGPTLLFYDNVDGRLLGEVVPGTGTRGDLISQAQFPLHSGRMLGFTGRVLVSLLGIAICVVVVTGVLIWRRKHLARRMSKTVPVPAALRRSTAAQ